MKNFFIVLVGISLGVYCPYTYLTEAVPKDYTAWKEDLKGVWHEKGSTLPEKRYSLLFGIYQYFDKQEKSEIKPSLLEALYSYNFLRELRGLPPASSTNEIDKTWLGEEDCRISKERLETLAEGQKEALLLEERFSHIVTIEYHLGKLTENPSSSPCGEEVLFLYNLLRKLSELPMARTLTEIDQVWLNAEGYKVLKEIIKTRWQQSATTTLTNHVISLIAMFDVNSESSREATREVVRHNNQKIALYAYNYLRELLHRTPAQIFPEIDFQWLSQVRDEALPYYHLVEREEYTPPTVLQKYLVKKAQDLLKIRSNLTIFSYGDRGKVTLLEPERYVMALCNTPDIDAQIATIYHELGHIVHRDSKNHSAIVEGKKTYEEAMQEPCVENGKIIEQCFKKDIEKIEHYFELGKKAFDDTTLVGRRVLDVLSKHDHFWTIPEADSKRQKMHYARGQEQRADLFELENLFKNHQLSAILQDIAQYAFGSSVIPIVAKQEDKHPADIERALYMAGFLVSKGLDINKLFQEWYAKGTCKALPKDILDSLFSMPPKTPGAHDFMRAYRLWQEGQENQAYQAWKEGWKIKTQVGEPEKVGLKGVYANRLMTRIRHGLMIAKKDPEYVFSQKETLYAYNYLRELSGETTVRHMENIDQAWLDKLAYKLYKESQREQDEMLGIETLEDQVNRGIDNFFYYARFSEIDPESTVWQRFLLQSYNYLRELLGESSISNWKDIDRTWVEVQRQKPSQETTQSEVFVT